MRMKVGLVRMESGSPLRRRMEVDLVRMEVGLVRMEVGLVRIEVGWLGENGVWEPPLEENGGWLGKNEGCLGENGVWEPP